MAYKAQGNPMEYIGVMNPVRGTWFARWGHGAGVNGQTDYWEELYDHRPTIDEVRDSVAKQVNSETSEAILRGMVWNDRPVWLSAENQRNFLLMETGTFPLRLKLGEDCGESVYHTFKNAEELRRFNAAVAAHIAQCLQRGYEMKDEVDWSRYE